jgi:hypothetical protein
MQIHVKLEVCSWIPPENTGASGELFGYVLYIRARMLLTLIDPVVKKPARSHPIFDPVHIPPNTQQAPIHLGWRIFVRDTSSTFPEDARSAEVDNPRG